MKVVLREAKRSAGVVVVPLFDKGPDFGRGEGVDAAHRQLVASARKSRVFRGELGEISVQVATGKGRDRPVVLVGFGNEKKLDPEALRPALGVLGRSLSRLEATRATLGLGIAAARRALANVGLEAGVRAMVEGAILGDYRFDARGRSRKRASGKTLVLDLSGLNAKDRTLVRRGAKIGAALATGVKTARDLGNAPANELYPQSLSTRARSLARAVGLRCKVLGKTELEREKMGALLAVAKGSQRAPRMIILEHRPRGLSKRALGRTVVLIGKAVTFDSGGLSIKPARGMEDMKFDMGGGAAVLGAMQAIAELSLPVHVVGLVPAAENHISGSAYRPGDVVRSASGKTIEVINTDAEGRLLLADALHYCRRYEPSAVVDIATLTGACVVALGTAASGLMANDRALADRILAASEVCGERVWELPLYDEYRAAVKSHVADVRNSSGRDAGACTAGAFLGHFIEGVSWAHIDIAGTGWTHRVRGYQARGATGAGVRVLFELVAASA